ncbi:MAG: YtxH domain-containing protein [Sphingobacteriales bacterium]|nr:MAG: YtxH domain-containing protein [Sphingobacteriales bacterium]
MKNSSKSNNNNMNNNTRTILTLVTGAVAGAVTALLLAPQTGEETRRTLSKTTSRLREDLNSTLAQGMEKINTLRGNAGNSGADSFDDEEFEGGSASTGSSYGRSQTGDAMRGAGNPTGLSNNDDTTSGLGGSSYSSRSSQGNVGNV